MQFADCRTRASTTNWWEGALAADATVDSKMLLAHATEEDVDAFDHLVAEIKARTSCVACGTYFRGGDALGRWQCRSPVTGRAQDHYRPTPGFVDTRPPDIVIPGWQYLALVAAGLIGDNLNNDGCFEAVYDPNSGHLMKMCIKRRSS